MKNHKTNNLFIITIILAIVLGISVGFGIMSFYRNLPKISMLEQYKPSLITKVLSDEGKIIKEYYEQRRILTKLEDIPKNSINATIAIEDQIFYRHRGIDIAGIIRAMLSNIKEGEIVQGGSTITQQLVKLLFLTQKRTFIRKIKEAILAYQIEMKYSKSEILTLYFNQVYFGEGAYGIAAAAQTFFGKTIQELNLSECAYLAGLPKAPSNYSPFKYPEKAKKRQEIVLKKMLEEKYITKEEYTFAKNFPIEIQKERSKLDNGAYFVEYVRNYVGLRYGEDLLTRGGLKIYTTLNLKLQQLAEKTVIEEIERINKVMQQQYEIKGIIVDTQLKIIDNLKEQENIKAQVVSCNTEEILIDFIKGKQRIKLESIKIKEPLKNPYPIIGETICLRKIENNKVGITPLVQSSFIAIEPNTGYIKAMVGGYNFNLSPFNRAIQSKRQPGSAFKLFTYTAAMANGFTPISTIDDSPIIFRYDNKEWAPQNYKNEFQGLVTLRHALADSINVVAVKLLEKVGIQEVIKYAQLMGIKSSLTKDLSLALGTSEVSNIEIASSYSTVANYGKYVEPTFILKIEDMDGKIIEESSIIEKDVISPQLAYMMISMLQSPVEEGTCQQAKRLNRPIAAKTGTTSEYADAWFIGFSPQLVTSVWVGFDKKRAMFKEFTGAGAAGPIWIKFMENALVNQPIESFYIPEKILLIEIDKKSGLIATSDCSKENIIEEVFIEGTEPTEYCNIHFNKRR